MNDLDRDLPNSFPTNSDLDLWFNYELNKYDSSHLIFGPIQTCATVTDFFCSYPHDSRYIVFNS